MNVSLYHFSEDQWISHPTDKPVNAARVQFVLSFSGKKKLASGNFFELIRKKFPVADILICSTAGEIFQDRVQDNSQVVVAFELEKTEIKTAVVNIGDFDNSYDAALALKEQLPHEGLAYMMVISDGSLVNGSELAKGLNDAARGILITGGLAGDAADFKSTLVGLNENPAEGMIAAVGFYGECLQVTHDSQGGWDMFGLEKTITRSSGNVLYEIENENALDIYKKYLGPEAEKLPAAALLFPLAVTIPGTDKPVVRTILSISEENKAMTFAGDVPEGSKVRFMRANFDKLTGAASVAAGNTMIKNRKPDFSMLISCVGRKLVLGPRIDEEVEAVIQTTGAGVPVSGFYSYGEISPFTNESSCQLHNQTMTITTFYELS